MASLVDLERLQNEKQMSHPGPAPQQQLQTFLSPSLTPQGPQRPSNEPILNNNKKQKATHSGNNLEMRLGGGSSEQRRNGSRTDVFANSFIHGRKVDSPKIFSGYMVSDDRPKTQAQHARKHKNKETTNAVGGKDQKKKANHQRKNATALNASQVVAPSVHLQGKTLLNLGLHTNKEVDSRKFDFGLPPHHSKVSSNQASANQSKKKNSIARTQNSKMQRHQRTYTTTQQDQLKNPQINNFFSDNGSAAAGSTLEFEPVNSGASSTVMSKNQHQFQSNATKSSKTVREKDSNGYAKTRSNLGTSTQGPSVAPSQTNSNYQQHRKRQLSQNMPKTLLNVSQSTGTKPSVSLNTTQIVSTKHSTGFCKPKASLNVPSTTKSLLVKPPIGSSLLSKKKSMQVNNNMDVSRSQRSAPGYHNQQSSNMGTQRTKSIERTSLALSQGKSKALQSQKVSKQTKSTSKTERGRGNYHSQLKTTTAGANNGNPVGGLKNLSAHLLEQANPISIAVKNNDSVRASLPVVSEKENMHLQTAYQQQLRTMRQNNLSGDDGDFSLSSMSDHSSHRQNKSTLNQSNVQGKGRVFGKNYFVDGEQLLRHISPSQPGHSPRRSSATDTGRHVDLLNVTTDHLSHQRMSRQLSGKRSKTTRAQRSQTSKQIQRPNINVATDDHGLGGVTSTLESNDPQQPSKMLYSNLMSGKTNNKGQLDEFAPQFALSSANDRKERSLERERSKSKGRGNMRETTGAVDKSMQIGSKKQKINSVDKLIKKNIRQKGKQTAEEMLKKFMEENQKKKRQKDLIQMNHEIKKQNASKVGERENGHSVIKPLDEKKHRSKSCIQNRDNFFHHSGVVSPNLKQYQVPVKEKGAREKSYDMGHNKQSMLSGGVFANEKKKHPARDKNCVIELSMLKKEVDDEIRRDRKKGVMHLKNPSSANAVNMSAIVKSSSHKERSQVRTSLNQRGGETVTKKGGSGSNSTQLGLNYTSLRRKDPELLLEAQNLTDGNIKARVKRVIQTGNIEYNGGGTPSGLNTSKIQKFIDKQKKRNAAKTKLQATIEHEKILRVHENLTKLHNFTVNNRLKSNYPKDLVIRQPPQNMPNSTTHAKRPNAFENVRSSKKNRESRSGKRQSDSYGYQQTFGLRGPSADRDQFLGDSIEIGSGRKMRGSRFNSTDSRRRSQGNRYQDPGETLHADEIEDDDTVINVYERQTRGSSPQTRKLSHGSRSRYSGSNATSPQDRANFSGSATAPLRVLKPKLASTSKHKSSQNQRDHSGGDSRLRSIEADRNNANYSITHHGLFQSLEPEKGGKGKEPVDTSKQFESLEPARAFNTQNAAAFDLSKQPSPQKSKSRSPPPATLQAQTRKQESENEAEKKKLEASVKESIKSKKERRQTTDNSNEQDETVQNKRMGISTQNVDDNQDLMVINQQSSERPSRDATGQSQRLKTSIPKLSLHKVQSHDSQAQHEPTKPKQQQKLDLPQSQKGQAPINTAYSNRSHRDPEISTSRSIFQRDTFRQFAGNGKLQPEDFNPEDYPKMIKIREEAITYQEKSQQKKIAKEFEKKLISPRTFQRKNVELEKWVTKEQEETKRTEKKFKQEWQKTATMMQYTQQNNESIRRILQGENSYPLASARYPNHSHRDDGTTQNGVLAMIYDRDQSSKESKKQSLRHSILDNFENDKEMILDSADSAELESSRRRNRLNNGGFASQAHTEDQFRQKHIMGSLKEAAAGASSMRSLGQVSNCEGPLEGSEAHLSDDLDKISIQDPARQDPKNQLIKDLRNLKINEKSEDTGSLQAATPKELQWQGLSSNGGEQSKKTSPIDNNASYIDKSMTRQYVDLQSQPSMSPNTVVGDKQFVDQFESRKASQDSKTNDSKQLNTRKIDTNSSYKSGESAPEPPGTENIVVKSGLARVTSYNQLQKDLLEEGSSHRSGDSKSQKQKDQLQSSQGISEDDESKNQDLKPGYDVIQLDQANINLAKKLMDEGSPNSIQSHPNALNQEELKDSMKRENFFLNKLTQSGSTSHDELSIDPEQKILQQLSNLNTQPLASPTMPNTTPLSTDSGAQKIKIEISGQPEQDIGNPHILNSSVALENLQSPLSQDSANLGIRMGSVSLSSSTSKDTGFQQILPHLAPDRLEDQSMATSQGPDLTFGTQQLGDTTNTTILEESKDDTKADSSIGNALGSSNVNSSLTSIDDKQKPVVDQLQIVHDDSTEKEKTAPGSNLSPQMQAEGENLTNELLQYLLQDLSGEGLDLLLNRQTRRQEEVRAQLRAQCTGIKTDLFAIERYVDEIHQKIAADPEGFFRMLYKPLTREALKVLNQLQNSEIGSCDHFDESFPQVLPLKLYLNLENKRKAKREEESKEAKEKEAAEKGMTVEELQKAAPSQNFDAECEHIHNKVLFDCINDSLLQFKPFGKDGEPLPWSRQNRRLKPTDDFNLNEIFEIVKHDLFRWAINLAGTLPRREFVYQGEFDDELFSEIREKKLVQLLAREMIETEPKWLNYEFEQAQVKIDVGDMILEQLVDETISILNEQGQRDINADDIADMLRTQLQMN